MSSIFSGTKCMEMMPSLFFNMATCFMNFQFPGLGSQQMQILPESNAPTKKQFLTRSMNMTLIFHESGVARHVSSFSLARQSYQQTWILPQPNATTSLPFQLSPYRAVIQVCISKESISTPFLASVTLRNPSREALQMIMFILSRCKPEIESSWEFTVFMCQQQVFGPRGTSLKIQTPPSASPTIMDYASGRNRNFVTSTGQFLAQILVYPQGFFFSFQHQMVPKGRTNSASSSSSQGNFVLAIVALNFSNGLLFPVANTMNDSQQQKSMIILPIDSKLCTVVVYLLFYLEFALEFWLIDQHSLRILGQLQEFGIECGVDYVFPQGSDPHVILQYIPVLLHILLRLAQKRPHNGLGELRQVIELLAQILIELDKIRVFLLEMPLGPSRCYVHLVDVGVFLQLAHFYFRDGDLGLGGRYCYCGVFGIHGKFSIGQALLQYYKIDINQQPTMNPTRLQKLTNLALKYASQLQAHKGQHIKIVEVGPRDGLQNQKKIVSLEDKIKLIDRLSESGLKVVEVGSFVSPKWVPQMASSKELYGAIKKVQGVSYPCLVPNIKGMETAIEIGVKEIAVFASATEAFSQKNLNCSIEQSLKRFEPVMEQAKKNNIKVRGYVSMVMGCPYEGEVKPEKVAQVTGKLFDLGCYQVSLGDTVGKGTPEKVTQLFGSLKKFPIEKLAVHFHDTFDNALENILTSTTFGCRIVDSSIGGLGGCPYSMKPVGNVCTENVVFVLEKAGFKTGVDQGKLKETGEWICGLLERPNLSIL